LNGGSDIENAYLNGSSLDIQITAALDYWFELCPPPLSLKEPRPIYGRVRERDPAPDYHRTEVREPRAVSFSEGGRGDVWGTAEIPASRGGLTEKLAGADIRSGGASRFLEMGGCGLRGWCVEGTKGGHRSDSVPILWCTCGCIRTVGLRSNERASIWSPEKLSTGHLAQERPTRK
jgi:hypothetical protein